MTAGQIVLLVAATAALSFGLWRAATDGRFRGTHEVRGIATSEAGETGEPREIGGDLAARSPVLSIEGVEWGERATLLQFSSAFCAPCRATRRVLADISAVVPGVAHVEIDAEHHLSLVRELSILRTPTTLVLDADGREVRRAAGAPRKEDVLAALAEAISRFETPVQYLRRPVLYDHRLAPTLETMFTTMLTKRRAVDHCRTRSSLCRMS